MPTFNNGESAASVRTKINDAIEKVDGTQSISSVDIDGGSIDGVTIGGVTAGAGTFSTATVNGNITVTGTVDSRDVASDGSKLDGVEALADVTDTANVTSAGALMDSEVTNLAAVKAFDPTDYATSAQGDLADSALQDGDTVASLAITTADINGGSIDGTAINTSTIDGTVIGGSTPAAISATTGSFSGDVTISSTAPRFYMMDTNTTDGNIEVLTNSNSFLVRQTTDDKATSKNRLLIGLQTGDISFFEDTGTTPKFYWDASTERLGLGTASPAKVLDVRGDRLGSPKDSGGVIRLSCTADSIIQDVALGSIEFFSIDPSGAGVGVKNRIISLAENSIGSLYGLAFEGADGTERMRIASNGDISFYEDTGTTPKFYWDASAERLGLGTVSPSAPLHIASASDGDDAIRISAATATNNTVAGRIVFADSSNAPVAFIGGGREASFDDGFLTFEVTKDGTTYEAMHIDRSGFVGIGTNSPDDELDIEGADPAIRLTDTSAVGFARMEGLNGSLVLQSDQGNTVSNSIIRFDVDGTERLRITSTGLVGIGTSSPATILHTFGTSATTYDPASVGGQDTSATLQIQNNSTSANTFAAIDFNTNLNRVVNRIVSGHESSTSNGFLSFVTEGGGVPAERLRIDSTGNVGIGTTVPTENLNVIGDISLGVDAIVNDGAFTIRGGSKLSGNPASNATQLTIAGGDAEINAAAGATGGGDLILRGGNASKVAGSNGVAGDIFIKAGAVTTNGFSGALNNGQIVFETTATERARIDASGNLLIGTTTNDPNSRGFNARMSVSTAFGVVGIGVNGFQTVATTAISFSNPNGLVGGIVTNGSATSYNTSSDYRLKEDVQPMSGASDRVLSLKPVNFAWKVDGTRVDGFLAHEAQAVVPEAVTGEKDGEEMQAIDQSKLVPLLTAALQEALKEIADLKGRITALEA